MAGGVGTRLRCGGLAGLVLSVMGCGATPAPATSPNKSVTVAAGAGATAEEPRVVCADMARDGEYCRLDDQCARDLEAAVAAGDRRREALVLRWWGEGSLEKGALAAARERLGRAVVLAKEIKDERAHAHALVLRGDARFQRGERDDGLAEVVKSRKVLDRIGDDEGVCKAMEIEAWQHHQRQNAEGALWVWEQMKRRGGACAKDAAWGLAVHAQTQGDASALHAELDERVKSGTDLDALRRQAVRLRQEGDAAGAKEAIERGKAYAARHCNVRHHLRFGKLEMRALTGAGRADESIAIGEGLKSLAEGLDNPGLLAGVYSELGDAHVIAGRYGEGRSFYLLSWHLRIEAGYEASIPKIHHDIARTYVAEAKYDKALEFLRTAEELSKKAPSQSLLLAIAHERGVVRLAQGRLDEAQEAFEAALAKARELKRSSDIMVLLANLGQIHETRCELREAQQLYQEALDFMVAAGRTSDAENLEALIDRVKRRAGQCAAGAP